MASYSSRTSSSKKASISSTKIASSSQFMSGDDDDDESFNDITAELPQLRLLPNLAKKSSLDKSSMDMDAMIAEALADRKNSLTSTSNSNQPGCTEMSTSKSKSSKSSAKLESSGSIVDGELVTTKIVAEKASEAKEKESVKRVDDGVVVVDKSQSNETSDKGKLKSTKAMSQEELDSFFRQKASSGYPVEELKFDGDTKTFDVKLQDLPEFCPDELTVKIVDNIITVIGRHEDKTDESNYKSQEYVRRFTIPKGLNNDNVAWTLEPNGILAISAGTTVKGPQVYHLDCTLYRPKSFFAKK